MDEGLFVLAGYVATRESWAAFSREWKEMLPYGVVGADGKYRFKMSEMAKLPERMMRVPAFYRIIEKHVPIGLSMALRVADFERGRNRLVVFNQRGQPVPIRGEVFENIYVFAFTRLMVMFHQSRANHDMQELFSLDEKVDFIFDERSEKKAIVSSWDEFLTDNQFREHYGATPRFEDDDEALPLQAADFFAWWIRKWEREGRTDYSRPYPWEAKREQPVIKAVMTEDNVFEDLKGIVLRLGEPRLIFDRNDLIRSSLGPSSEPFQFQFRGHNT